MGRPCLEVAVRPSVVGISCNLAPPEDRHFYKGKALHYGEVSMARAVEGAGGVPVFLPIPADLALVRDFVSIVDGVLLSGGDDVEPSFYGEELADERWAGQPERDAF